LTLHPKGEVLAALRIPHNSDPEGGELFGARVLECSRLRPDNPPLGRAIKGHLLAQHRREEVFKCSRLIVQGIGVALDLLNQAAHLARGLEFDDRRYLSSIRPASESEEVAHDALSVSHRQGQLVCDEESRHPIARRSIN